MKNFFLPRLLACLTMLAVFGFSGASAAPFTPGNLVVVRIGDGTALLTSAATATFLLEYTPAGVLVQTIALPTTATGTNSILTNTGSSTSDALLTRSVNGRYLVLTGYDAAVGTLALTTTASATNNRVIGRVDANGTVDTSTRLADAFSGTALSAANIRSAASVDGTAFYAVGSNAGVRYVPFGNAAATATTALTTAAPTNNRAVGIYNGNLYVGSASGANFGISQVGIGRPTTAGQPITQLPGFPTATGPSPYAFYFADLSTAVAGIDVVYIADDRAAPDGGIQKWSLVAGTWVLNGTILNGATALGLRGLNAQVSGTTVTLAASGNAGLFLVTDNAGYNAAPSTATLPAALVTAVTNTAFRGVAFAPAAPTITGITPASAVAGNTATTITITGTGFVANSIANVSGLVAFTGLPVTFVSATQLTITLPAYASAGSYNVNLVNNPGFTGVASNTVILTLTALPNAPTITGFTPLGGSAGDLITVTGTNFTGATAVRLLNTISGLLTNVSAFTVVSATTLTFNMPLTPTSVRILVTTPNGTATSFGIFNIVTSTRAGQALPGLTVFPNPASNRVTVALPTAAPATVALRDLAGRVVLAPAALGADQQLELPAALAPGIYLLEVRQGDATAIRRLEKN